MKQGSQQHQTDKRREFPAQQIPGSEEHQSQGKIIADRIVGLKVIAQHHEQEKRGCEVIRLLPDRRQEKRQCRRRDQGEDKQVIFKAAQRIHRADKGIEPRLRRHIGMTADQMHEIYIFCVVVSRIDPQRERKKQRRKQQNHRDP